MKDEFKRATMEKYTAWDLNCPWIVRRTKSKRRLMKQAKRNARRTIRINLKKYLTD